MPQSHIINPAIKQYVQARIQQKKRKYIITPCTLSTAINKVLSETHIANHTSVNTSTHRYGTILHHPDTGINRMTTTNDKELYRLAWEHHIDELAMLALRAKIEYDDYKRVKDILNTWLTTALQHTKE